MPTSQRRRLVVSGAQWAAGAWLLARVRFPRPSPAGSTAGPRRLRVSVLIPARNEARSLPHLLASLRAQSAPADEVIVVDDASEDGTGAVARAGAGGVRVLDSAGPPAGWSGKCWALHQAQAAATGDVLVFLDADVTLAPDGLGRIVGELARLGGRGLVSAEPFHRTERPYEQLSGVCNIVALMGTGSFTGPPGRPATMAFGPCMAIDRESYDLAGGHAHPDVRSRLTEDLALARRVRSCHVPVAVFAGGGVVAFRMYPDGLRALLDGWTRVLLTGAGGGPRRITLAVAFWVTGALQASGSGARALSGVARRSPEWRVVAVETAAYGMWAAQIGWMLRLVGRFGPTTAALFPLPLSVFVVCCARSTAKIGLGRPLAWRGRTLTGR